MSSQLSVVSDRGRFNSRLYNGAPNRKKKAPETEASLLTRLLADSLTY